MAAFFSRRTKKTEDEAPKPVAVTEEIAPPTAAQLAALDYFTRRLVSEDHGNGAKDMADAKTYKALLREIQKNPELFPNIYDAHNCVAKLAPAEQSVDNKLTSKEQWNEDEEDLEEAEEESEIRTEERRLWVTKETLEFTVMPGTTSKKSDEIQVDVLTHLQKKHGDIVLLDAMADRVDAQSIPYPTALAIEKRTNERQPVALNIGTEVTAYKGNGSDNKLVKTIFKANRHELFTSMSQSTKKAKKEFMRLIRENVIHNDIHDAMELNMDEAYGIEWMRPEAMSASSKINHPEFFILIAKTRSDGKPGIIYKAIKAISPFMKTHLPYDIDAPKWESAISLPNTKLVYIPLSVYYYMTEKYHDNEIIHHTLTKGSHFVVKLWRTDSSTKPLDDISPVYMTSNNDEVVPFEVNVRLTFVFVKHSFFLELYQEYQRALQSSYSNAVLRVSEVDVVVEED